MYLEPRQRNRDTIKTTMIHVETVQQDKRRNDKHTFGPTG